MNVGRGDLAQVILRLVYYANCNVGYQEISVKG